MWIKYTTTKSVTKKIFAICYTKHARLEIERITFRKEVHNNNEQFFFSQSRHADFKQILQLNFFFRSRKKIVSFIGMNIQWTKCVNWIYLISKC